MKLLKLFFIPILLLSFGMNAQQENVETHPTTIGTVSSMTHVSSIASRSNELTPPVTKTRMMMDGRSSSNVVIPGKGELGDDILAKHKSKLEGKLKGSAVDLVWTGAQSNSMPTDPSLAVGPDHVLVVFNSGWRVFDKDGAPLTSPMAPNPSIFPTGGCCDLTVSYDNAADRWIISFLNGVGGGLQVAISDGPDPVNDGWYVYDIPQVNDYNKLSVWSDGYYITDNSFGGNKLYVMERDAMIAGDDDAQVVGFPLPGMFTNGFSSPQAFNVSNGNFPAAGNAPIVFLQDNSFGGVATDHIKMWLANMNWSDPGSSTISSATQFPTAAFTSVFDGGSFSNLAQPGGSLIDALQSTIMNQAQFRKFSTHNSAVFNFVVDVDPTFGKLAGIRWFEFRQDGDNMPWSLFQEGTYTSPDGKHAWNASLIMDWQGNIGMGYTAMTGDNNTTLGSYYTGRYVNDAPGTMSVMEETIIVGNANIPGVRYGDYSKIDVDPVDDSRFYFINEVMNSGRKDMVGRFQIISEFANDIGAVAVDPPADGVLTDSEPITVTIFNYGFEDAAGFNVNYQVNGGAVITEAFPGTIGTATSADYTFTTTADLSIEGQEYTINAYTSWEDDQQPDNDAVLKMVTHLYAVDSGVDGVSSPSSAIDLSDSETITVSITNHGSQTQTSVPVYYSVDGGDVVEETYTGSIAVGESDTYTFTETADFSVLGLHEIVAGTGLSGDSDESNDEIIVEVFNLICQPASDCTNFNSGLTQIQLADQDISCDCSETGYTDNTDIIFNFVLENNPFNGTLQVGTGNTNYVIWIDFNDNYEFESTEIVSMGTAASSNVDLDFVADFDDLANNPGMHLMRVRGIWGATFDELTNPTCDDVSDGRTNDYTANISGAVGVEQNDFASADLNISYLTGNQFNLSFVTDTYTDKLPVTIMNSAGQILAYYTLQNSGVGYSKLIDMSHVSPGVYFVKVGSDNLNKVKRIIVE